MGANTSHSSTEGATPDVSSEHTHDQNAGTSTLPASPMSVGSYRADDEGDDETPAPLVDSAGAAGGALQTTEGPSSQEPVSAKNNSGMTWEDTPIASAFHKRNVSVVVAEWEAADAARRDEERAWRRELRREARRAKRERGYLPEDAPSDVDSDEETPMGLPRDADDIAQLETSEGESSDSSESDAAETNSAAVDPCDVVLGADASSTDASPLQSTPGSTGKTAGSPVLKPRQAAKTEPVTTTTRNERSCWSRMCCTSR